MTLTVRVQGLLLSALRRPIMGWRLAGFLTLAALLGGCASLRTSSPAPGTPAASLTAWQGRFSVTYPDSANAGQVQRASGRFRLEQRGPLILLELANPLGQTLANARLESGLARLMTAEGREFAAANDQALLEQVFGWRVPVFALPAWLRGQFVSMPPVASGQPLQLEEAGWAVRISAWQDDRPRVLQLSWPADSSTSGPREALRLQLIVDAAS
jgi:outer membrane lipoprotein LolB